MKKIKSFLIHLLGGHTHKEMCDELVRSNTLARLDTLYTIRKFAEQMNGIPADDWCKRMYNHICGCIKRLENEEATTLHQEQ